jgi:hypothetical protein
MKINSGIVIVVVTLGLGVTGGYLVNLYFKNKSGGTTGNSQNPLSASEQKITDTVLSKIKQDEAIIAESQMKEAKDYLIKRTLIEQLEAIKKIKTMLASTAKNRPQPSSALFQEAGIDTSVKNYRTTIFDREKLVRATLDAYGVPKNSSGEYRLD